MADLNRVTLIGRLTKDPELRHTASGDPVCSMRLAVNARARDENGQWGDKPNFFDVVVFGRQAENASTYLAKGRRVGIDGRLSWREWQAQDGGRRQSVEVIANDMMFLDGRDGSAGGGGAGGGGWSDSAPTPAPSGMPVDTSDMAPATPQGSDDDIPF
jgi:single-strand DNA-binding protein